MNQKLMDHHSRYHHRTWRLIYCFIVFFINSLFFWFPSISFGDFEAGISTDPSAGIAMKISSPFTDIPDSGTFPLHVEITNLTSSDLTWVLNATTSNSAVWRANTKSTYALTVPASSRQRYDLLIPLLARPKSASNNSSYNNLVGEISGRGVKYGHFNIYPQNRKNYHYPSTPYIAVSDKLVGARDLLETEFDAQHQKNFLGSVFDSKKLPGDWRALSGVEAIWLSTGDLSQLPVNSKASIKDWVFRGGSLVVATEERSCTLDELKLLTDNKLANHVLPAASPIDFGLGYIECFQSSPQHVMASIIEKTILGQEHPLLHGRWSSISTKSRLAELFAKPVEEGVLVFVLVVLYATTVGPLNLYKFASKGKRYRLYWTTPLIAVTTTILIASYVLLKEGTGGVGKRITAVLLQSEEKLAFALQEQVSKTALLVSTSFPFQEKFLITPLARADISERADSYKHRKKYSSTQEEATLAGTYSWSNSEIGGDFFGSRSLQSQLIERFIPSRAHIEVSFPKGSAPQLQSSVSGILDEIYVFDATGKFWRAGQVRPGELITLLPATSSQFDRWKKISLSYAGEALEQFVDTAQTDIRGQEVRFVARLKGNSNFILDTHTDISWEDDTVVVFGRALTSETRSQTTLEEKSDWGETT